MKFLEYGTPLIGCLMKVIDFGKLKTKNKKYKILKQNVEVAIIG